MTKWSGHPPLGFQGVYELQEIMVPRAATVGGDRLTKMGD